MTELELIKKQIKSLFLEVENENLNDTLNKLTLILKNYNASGANGKPVYDFLIELDREFTPEGDAKEEFIVDTTSRLVGYASPHWRIIFKDYDLDKREWKNEC